MTSRPSIDAYANEDGDLGGRISARVWSSFPVDLRTIEDGVVLCERLDQTPHECWQRESMFEEFLGLANRDDQAILRFAERYGTLGLCPHGVPLTGNCQRLTTGPCEVERLDHWRDWARRFAATIEVGWAVMAGDQPKQSAVNRMLSGHSTDLPWSGLDRHFDVKLTAAWLNGTVGKVKKELLRNAQAWHFSRFINRWLTLQAVVMPSKVAGARLRMEYGSRGLFSALALQAALAATGASTLVICSNCGRPFAATRRPAKGRRSYCEKRECRVLAAQRDAARAYRARELR
jgi:hypothetical protein